MDELIEKAGNFGPFQYKVILIVGLASALSSACIYATIFTAAEPDFFCRYGHNTSTSIKLSFEDSCRFWIQSGRNSINVSNSTWCEFDQTYYGKTIINEWSLICDKHYKASLTQTIHIFGSIFGFFSGTLGDRFGRRKSVLFFSFLLTFTLLSAQLFLSAEWFGLGIDAKYYIYSVSQFLIGFLDNCLYCTAYVLLMEFTTEHYRTRIANLNSYIYVLGELIVLVVYYFSRNWHVLNWFVGCYSLVILGLIYFYLPESPAWYISQNKLNEALRVLKSIARANKTHKGGTQISYRDIKLIQEKEKSLMNESDDTIDYLSIKHNHNHANTVLSSGEVKLVSGDDDETVAPEDKSQVEEEKSACMILGNLFRPRKNCVKTLLLVYIWAALMLIYYGVSLGITMVDLVDPYLMYFLSCIAELVGYQFCYLNDRLGRRKMLIAFFITPTIIYALIVMLTVNSVEDSDELSNSVFSTKAVIMMILALMGKCAVSGAYNISYIYTSELHPTYTRNTALLFLNCLGSISSLIAPQINMLRNLISRPAPYVVYSVSALFACVCVWVLPETKADP